MSAAAAIIEPAEAAVAADSQLQAVRPLRAQALLRLGDLRVQQRRLPEAITALSEALLLREQTDVPDSPWLAEVRVRLDAARRAAQP